MCRVEGTDARHVDVLEILVGSEHEVRGSAFVRRLLVPFLAGATREEEPLIVDVTPYP